MRVLLVLPLLLVLASCGAAGARTARTAAEPLPLVMGGTATVSVGPNLIGPIPLDRYAAADGPITSAATDYARAACPAF